MRFVAAVLLATLALALVATPAMAKGGDQVEAELGLSISHEIDQISNELGNMFASSEPAPAHSLSEVAAGAEATTGVDRWRRRHAPRRVAHRIRRFFGRRRRHRRRHHAPRRHVHRHVRRHRHRRHHRRHVHRPFRHIRRHFRRHVHRPFRHFRRHVHRPFRHIRRHIHRHVHRPIRRVHRAIRRHVPRAIRHVPRRASPQVRRQFRKLQKFLATHRGTPAAAQAKQKLKAMKRKVKQQVKARKARRAAKKSLKKAKRQARQAKKKMIRRAKAAQAQLKQRKLKAKQRRLKNKARGSLLNKQYYKEALEFLGDKIKNISATVRDVDLPRVVTIAEHGLKKPWVPHLIGQNPDLRMPLPDASADWKPHEPLFRNMSNTNQDASSEKVITLAAENRKDVQEIMDVFPWPVPNL